MNRGNTDDNKSIKTSSSPLANKAKWTINQFKLIELAKVLKITYASKSSVGPSSDAIWNVNRYKFLENQLG